jgi:DivIVA domain-containing protein
MDVDRKFVEKSDFSTARRGYDPEEVDAHLKAIGEKLDEARREQSSAKLAGAAAEQVRVIVEAAERSAAEIQEKAELQAKRTQQELERGAQEARARADEAAAQEMARVEEATGRMLERADTLESEVNRMLDQLREQAESIVAALRGGAERVDAELAHMRSGLTGIQAARSEVEAPAEVPAEEAVAEDVPAMEEEPGPVDAEPEVVEAVEETVEEEAEAPAEEAMQPTGRFSRGGGGAEGARLVALNMALNGTPRAETARYLSENFEIEDQDALLDDVYAQVGGPA